MDIVEIFSDALVYPLNNLKALLVYIILGVILGIAIGGSLAAVMAGIAIKNPFAVIGSGMIGIVVALLIGFIITGYELDIVKYGIQRSFKAPEIDIVRQFVNGIKLFGVSVFYFIIPLILGSILAAITQHWISAVISWILYIIFGFAATMGQCRLAKTEDLMYALAFREAFADIGRVGLVKLLMVIIVVAIVSLILFVIGGFITQWNSTVGGIIMGIIGVYLVFFTGRATGLLYSDV